MSESQRETYSLKLTSGMEVVFYSYLIGSDLETIEYAGMSDNNSKTDKSGVVSFDAGKMMKARKEKEIELSIHSFNGNEDKQFILNGVRRLRATEYKKVMAEVDKIVNPIDEEEKKK